MKNQINVEQWIAMFREIGLDDAKMKQWHKVFESQHPAAHQKFLEWLGLPAKDIDRIRVGSRA